MQTYSDLLMQWPSLKGLAEACDIKPINVIQWKRRNSIPPGYWRTVCRDGKQHGIDINVNMLLDIEEREIYED